MNTKKIDFLLLVLYCGFIFWLSSRQTLPAPMWFDHQDKLYHAGAYGLMGGFAWRAFRHIISSSIILILLSIIFPSLYGISDEWHQSFVPGRDSSIEDWIADTVGAIIGVLGLNKLYALKAQAGQTQAAPNCTFNCTNCSTHEQASGFALNSKPKSL